MELLGGGRELKLTLRDSAGGCVTLFYRLQGRPDPAVMNLLRAAWADRREASEVAS